MQYKPANVTLVEVEIKIAIDQYVQKMGYDVKKVTLEATPHQRNGPDSFSALVEVMPKGATEDLTKA